MTETIFHWYENNTDHKEAKKSKEAKKAKKAIK
jgi:hypothetical protein